MGREFAEPRSMLPHVIAQCRRRRRVRKMSDSTGVSLNAGDVLIRALALREVLRRHVLDPDERHVGVILPPTVAGAIVNLALALDRRVPVNLNFVMSSHALQASIDQAGVRHVLTSQKVLDRLSLTFDAESVVVEELRGLVGRRDKAVAALLGAVLPASLLVRWLGLNRVDSQEVFTILFTSGATGDPKGVMLSHANIASNCQAMADRVGIDDHDVLMGVLPFFHAFGLTVTLWMPLLTDASVVYHTNPLEAEAVGRLSKEYGATILLITPTILRLYNRQIPAEDFATLTMVATGAEPLPAEIRDRFATKFGVRPFEGYGTTETSPAIAFNVPPERWRGAGPAPIRDGTVGKPIPDVRLRVIDRVTEEPLPDGEEGILEVSGPNVMLGYLGRPDLTVKVLRDGWYSTGDVARIDEGFITLTGRESQFSKIAGESVPHLLIETSIARILAEFEAEQHAAAVTSVKDARKGERIVVVHVSLPVSPEAILARLRNSGLPPLFLPALDGFIEVESLPMLGSGKIDLRALRSLAEAAFDEQGKRRPGTSGEE
jgi:acyl-[acyl-carrier-protein]-phospholipid O-acyltransferase / long-chain-fatty-acid--[acyl-carrier-protein] ligase